MGKTLRRSRRTGKKVEETLNISKLEDQDFENKIQTIKEEKMKSVKTKAIKASKNVNLVGTDDKLMAEAKAYIAEELKDPNSDLSKMVEDINRSANVDVDIKSIIDNNPVLVEKAAKHFEDAIKEYYGIDKPGKTQKEKANKVIEEAEEYADKMRQAAITKLEATYTKEQIDKILELVDNKSLTENEVVAEFKKLRDEWNKEYHGETSEDRKESDNGSSRYAEKYKDEDSIGDTLLEVGATLAVVGGVGAIGYGLYKWLFDGE